MSAATPRRRLPITPRRALIATLAIGLIALLVAMLSPSTDDSLAGERSWTVRSPQKKLTADVTARDGALSLTVRRDGKRVLSTRLGKMARAKVHRDTLKQRFSTPLGKRRDHQLDARRLTLTAPGGRKLEVVAADDGVAFRQTGAGRENTRFRAPDGTYRWLQSYRIDYEGPYRGGRLGETPGGDYAFPALLRTPDGTYALLTESGLTREPAAHLRVDGKRPGALDLVLPDGEASPRTTPWRLAVVGDLQTVVGSDLPLSLGKPSKIRDTSWIKPGRASWSWWSDGKSPENPDRLRAFIREAHKRGWEHSLLDAGWWNAGPTQKLVRYANKRNVKLTVWTAWDSLQDPAERERRFKEWHDLGIYGVKVDFLESDSASRMAYMEDVARTAAKYRMVINFHGSTIPRGIQRTWPNVVTLEGIRGSEHEIDDYGAHRTITWHGINAAFTRNVVGSMDYTPVALSSKNQVTTAGHRLAQAVVFESGHQNFADSPETYAKFPAADSVLNGVPAAWDDTRLVDGDPDHYVTMARKSGDTWWVGSMTADGKHQRPVKLDFLDGGRTYAAHVVRDDGQGNLTTEDHQVTSGDTLNVDVEAKGGFTIQLTPQG